MLEANQHLAAQVFEHSFDGIYITDDKGFITKVNPAFTQITGYSAADVVGKKPADISSGWHDVNFAKDILPCLKETQRWQGELLSRRANGEAFLVNMSICSAFDAHQNFLGLITSFRDITQARHEEESIRQLAYYDPLTELPNRSLFEDRLLQALHRSNRQRSHIALLFLDLDGFKAVNDTYGHALGDRLLKQVADRLQACIRSDDTAARLGGDEFTILLHALTEETSAELAVGQIAKKVITMLNRVFTIDQHHISVGVSIGIALYPSDGLTSESLLKNADTAMYHAKKSGKNQYQFFTEDIHQRAAQRAAVEQGLFSAIDAKEFHVDFQPQFTVNECQLSGFEAVLRWSHPVHEQLKPQAFMRLIEELGLGSKVGSWLIEKACEQLFLWQQSDSLGRSLTINVFAHHYREGALVNSVEKALKRHAIAPDCLTFSFSESVILEDIGFAYTVLNDLHQLGVRIAVNDFATGLFSLHYLHQLPIDQLKIDRQFMQNIEKSSKQRKIVDAIIGIARSFGCDVVVAAVDNESQLITLRASPGCKEQNVLFSQSHQRLNFEWLMQKDNNIKVIFSESAQ